VVKNIKSVAGKNNFQYRLVGNGRDRSLQDRSNLNKSMSELKEPQVGGEKEKLNKWADTLDQLQSKENGGRGVSCVRTIITVLRQNDLGGARAVCFNEGDKIRSYPEIRQFVVEELFAGAEEHPYSSEERLEKLSDRD